MLTLSDVMTSDVIALTPHTTLRDAVEILTRHHVSGAPVLSGGRVVGTLSASDVLAFETSLPGVPTGHEETDDLLETATDSWDDETVPPAAYFTDLWEDAGADVAERFTEIDGPEWDVLAEHVVQEAMSTQVLSLPPEAPVHLAAQYMTRSGVHRLLVLEAEALVGIVTTMDITQTVARLQMREPLSLESPSQS